MSRFAVAEKPAGQELFTNLAFFPQAPFQPGDAAAERRRFSMRPIVVEDFIDEFGGRPIQSNFHEVGTIGRGPKSCIKRSIFCEELSLEETGIDRRTK